jgi:hypothetical protein
VVGLRIIIDMRSPILVDEEGVPCLVQYVRYTGLNDGYQVIYFDDTVVYIYPDYVENHYMVVHSWSQLGYYDFQPIIEQLENYYKEIKKQQPMDRS